MSLIEQEDTWRRKFCEEPNAPELDDLHLGLKNVFQNRELFRYEAETPEEVSFVLIMHLTPNNRKQSLKCSRRKEDKTWTPSARKESILF